MLGDDDLFTGDETAGGGSGRFHEGLPVAAFLSCFSACFSGDQLCRFGGADGFAFVAVCGALGEEGENGLLKCGVRGGGFLVAAGFAAVFDDVPVLSPLFLEGEGTAAGLAEFFFARSGAVGFGFAVGHASLNWMRN